MQDQNEAQQQVVDVVQDNIDGSEQQEIKKDEPQDISNMQPRVFGVNNQKTNNQQEQAQEPSVYNQDNIDHGDINQQMAIQSQIAAGEILGQNYQQPNQIFDQKQSDLLVPSKQISVTKIDKFEEEKIHSLSNKEKPKDLYHGQSKSDENKIHLQPQDLIQRTDNEINLEPKDNPSVANHSQDTSIKTSQKSQDDRNTDEEEEEHFVAESPTGRFRRFNDLIGHGAYKKVYKGIDTETGREVAWSVIHLSNLPKSERPRIKSEINIIKKLKHPNIITFVSAWIDKEYQQIHLITEMITGGSLRQYLGRMGKLKLKVIKQWCHEVLEGLKYLHSEKIIHRDIKCDNIFINSNSGEIKIGDLGLSTAMMTTHTESVLGTPEFMAPELYEESYDTAVDIYAFGMALLEMLTREVPYRECTNPAQIYKKVSQRDMPQSLQRVLDPQVKTFIVWCLADRQERPTAEQILNSIFMLDKENENNSQPCKISPATNLKVKKSHIVVDHPIIEKEDEELPERDQTEDGIDDQHAKKIAAIQHSKTQQQPDIHEKRLEEVNKHKNQENTQALQQQQQNTEHFEKAPKLLKDQINEKIQISSPEAQKKGSFKEIKTQRIQSQHQDDLFIDSSQVDLNKQKHDNTQQQEGLTQVQDKSKQQTKYDKSSQKQSRKDTTGNEGEQLIPNKEKNDGRASDAHPDIRHEREGRQNQEQYDHNAADQKQKGHKHPYPIQKQFEEDYVNYGSKIQSQKDQSQVQNKLSYTRHKKGEMKEYKDASKDNTNAQTQQHQQVQAQQHSQIQLQQQQQNNQTETMTQQDQAPMQKTSSVPSGDKKEPTQLIQPNTEKLQNGQNAKQSNVSKRKSEKIINEAPQQIQVDQQDKIKEDKIKQQEAQKREEKKTQDPQTARFKKQDSFKEEKLGHMSSYSQMSKSELPNQQQNKLLNSQQQKIGSKNDLIVQPQDMAYQIVEAKRKSQNKKENDTTQNQQQQQHSKERQFSKIQKQQNKHPKNQTGNNSNNMHQSQQQPGPTSSMKMGQSTPGTANQAIINKQLQIKKSQTANKSIDEMTVASSQFKSNNNMTQMNQIPQLQIHHGQVSPHPSGDPEKIQMQITVKENDITFDYQLNQDTPEVVAREFVLQMNLDKDKGTYEQFKNEIQFNLDNYQKMKQNMQNQQKIQNQQQKHQQAAVQPSQSSLNIDKIQSCETPKFSTQEKQKENQQKQKHANHQNQRTVNQISGDKEQPQSSTTQAQVQKKQTNNPQENKMDESKQVKTPQLSKNNQKNNAQNSNQNVDTIQQRKGSNKNMIQQSQNKTPNQNVGSQNQKKTDHNQHSNQVQNVQGQPQMVQSGAENQKMGNTVNQTVPAHHTPEFLKKRDDMKKIYKEMNNGITKFFRTIRQENMSIEDVLDTMDYTDKKDREFKQKYIKKIMDVETEFLKDKNHKKNKHNSQNQQIQPNNGKDASQPKQLNKDQQNQGKSQNKELQIQPKQQNSNHQQNKQQIQQNLKVNTQQTQKALDKQTPSDDLLKNEHALKNQQQLINSSQKIAQHGSGSALQQTNIKKPAQKQQVQTNQQVNQQQNNKQNDSQNNKSADQQQQTKQGQQSKSDLNLILETKKRINLIKQAFFIGRDIEVKIQTFGQINNSISNPNQQISPTKVEDIVKTNQAVPIDFLPIQLNDHADQVLSDEIKKIQEKLQIDQDGQVTKNLLQKMDQLLERLNYKNQEKQKRLDQMKNPRKGQDQQNNANYFDNIEESKQFEKPSVMTEISQPNQDKANPQTMQSSQSKADNNQKYHEDKLRKKDAEQGSSGTFNSFKSKPDQDKDDGYDPDNTIMSYNSKDKESSSGAINETISTSQNLYQNQEQTSQLQDDSIGGNQR